MGHSLLGLCWCPAVVPYMILSSSPNIKTSYDVSGDGLVSTETRSGARESGTSPVNHLHNQTLTTTTLPSRDDKLLSIFTLVRFPNVVCSVGSTSGTCLTPHDCTRLAGTQLGSCADNFGVCCYIEVSCGGTSSTNGTHLVSPGYPATYTNALTCTITFTRTPQHTCQLRLDFLEFESFPPDQYGKCVEDQMKVDGEPKFQYLCGTSPPDWHFYLDVAGKPNPTVFTFLTTSSTFVRKFKIRISTIPCHQRIPGGCGQYFTSTTGTIQSFNYGGFYLAGVDYAICFRKEKDMCTTTLKVQGPSFVACPNDLYRLPVGQMAANSALSALNPLSLYCQLNTQVTVLLPLAMIQARRLIT
ncbi:hypothetical protein Pmani_007478 [Petrolisthes manimaculis]|uniref:CUB domain-containing protein n=1 Tax=Petrolisthes manimaculis TaxID=1843537 RepID=A0AAE1UES5_9EUCA|nr:hypothetical protein Pmani_007478 [Petrolisthes manimaculis]